MKLTASNRSASGVALVITLIMLSVITFMAITFLVLSHRQRGQVTTTTDQTTARFTADSAIEHAKTEMLAPILAFTNDQLYGLMVSTNYINGNGFNPAAPAVLQPNPANPNTYTSNPTNVNYEYLTTGGRLNTSGEQLQNLANLQFYPRVPVYVTNRLTGQLEHRFYLDLNRNGRFETNGWLPVIGPDGKQIGTSFTNYVGDPEWVGVLAHPEWPHSASNQFVAEYAYMVAPSGKTLDMNFAHNYARRLNPAMDPTVGDGFTKDQGVGSYEINLGAFFTDLDTNIWNPAGNPYIYDYQDLNQANSGFGFDDALSLLRYRYSGLWSTLVSPRPSADYPNIDEYVNGAPGGRLAGNLMTRFNLVADNNDNKLFGFPGADNLSHLFTTQDLFDRNKVGTNVAPAVPALSDRLLWAGTSNAYAERYTFYRLQAQLGTDSSPEQDKINLNYRNVINGAFIPYYPTLETTNWTPIDFFTNAAQAMFAQLNLRDYAGGLITITNIPLYPTNYYTPAVHRVLQLAANIYDATTNRMSNPTQVYPYLPSVFRPYFFRNANGVVSIVGFLEVTNDVASVLNPYREFAAVPAGVVSSDINIFGVPWVIGAKKGLPNFNLCAMNSFVQVSRKLQLFKTDPKGLPTSTKQLYSMTISNQLGIEAWNSYTSAYPRNLRLIVTNDYALAIRNDLGVNLALTAVTRATNYSFGAGTNIPAWRGFDSNFVSRSMVIPVFTNNYVISNATYHLTGTPGFVTPNAPNQFEAVTGTMPRWNLFMRRRLRLVLLDTDLNRVVDFVNLDHVDALDLTSLLLNDVQCPPAYPVSDPRACWCTNRIGGTPLAPGITMAGMQYQLQISLGQSTVPDWNDPVGGIGKNADQITRFSDFVNGNDTVVTNNMQAPFTPSFTTNMLISWEANDPLVHYTVEDLTDREPVGGGEWTFDPTPGSISVNHRYRPWNFKPESGGEIFDSDNDVGKKDPGLKSSDQWDFPTNRLPNIGWLGRVHRGTPWQTIYMKSSPVNPTNWVNWTGSTNLFLAGLMMPTNDWRLFDLFTTELNPNAGRGRLSINQEGLAAWSAVLSGVIVPTDTSGNYVVIQPAALSPELSQIVKAINDTRTATLPSGDDRFPGKTFSSLGEILAVPELTERSPFLATTNLQLSSTPPYNITDEIVERIPQQVMSLLQLDHAPRFVIYAYAHALRPAERSVITSGPYMNMVTNYQVTAEYAVRALVHVEGSPDPRHGVFRDPDGVVRAHPDSAGRTYPPHIVTDQFNILPPD